MPERFQAQLQEFRQDDEAHWKYEAEEIQRQLRIMKGTGRTDEQVKAELKRAGINVSALEEEEAKEAQQLKRAHEEIRQLKPPPSRRGRKEPILMQQVAA
ncbi:MAG: hypothetical protein KJ077_24960 [Anaerolineae bacterium]|nr:hypothetical protein [Anaerolineae bacterium]